MTKFDIDKMIKFIWPELVDWAQDSHLIEINRISTNFIELGEVCSDLTVILTGKLRKVFFAEKVVILMENLMKDGALNSSRFRRFPELKFSILKYAHLIFCRSFRRNFTFFVEFTNYIQNCEIPPLRF